MLKLEQTEKILRGLVDAGWMGSYALLVRHGSEKAAIIGKNVDADTLFEVASLTKVTVTAPLAMMSIAEGKLALEDHLGDFFSGLTVMRDVTVFRLLTHTSGIPDYFDESVLDDYAQLWRETPNYSIRSSSDLLPLFLTKPMMFERGAKFQYNNTGFVVLGLILEAISGVPFDVYLEKAVFHKCGMRKTGYYELDCLPANCAHNYIFDPDKQVYRTNIYSVDVKGTGAGGAFTTVKDIRLFWQALLSHRLLSAEMTRKMLSKHSGNDQDGFYGYGIWLRKAASGAYYPYFQGGDPGVSFLSEYHPNHDASLTLVSNFRCNVWGLVQKLRAQLLDEDD